MSTATRSMSVRVRKGNPAMTQPACEWVWVLSGGRIHRTLHHALYMYEHHMEHQERNSRVRISLVKPRHPPAGIMIIMTTVLCTRKQTHRDDGWVPGRVSRVNEDLKRPRKRRGGCEACYTRTRALSRIRTESRRETVRHTVSPLAPSRHRAPQTPCSRRSSRQI